jgi:hypothetical protein
MPVSAAICRSPSWRAPIASTILAAGLATRLCRLSLPQCCRLPCGAWNRASPGDSGGALLVEGAQGQLYYLGVISAQRGLFPEIAANASERRSLATALYPSLGFIADRARALGYLP